MRREYYCRVNILASAQTEGGDVITPGTWRPEIAPRGFTGFSCLIWTTVMTGEVPRGVNYFSMLLCTETMYHAILLFHFLYLYLVPT